MSSEVIEDNATWYCEPWSSIRLTGPNTINKEKLSFYYRAQLLFPIALVTILTGIIHLLLKPLGVQITFVSQMLAGIALGPTFLGHNEKTSDKIFTPRTRLIINVVESLGLIYTTFVTAVKVDVNIFKKSGKLGIIIGIGSFVLPLMVTSFLVMLVQKFVTIDDELSKSLRVVPGLEAAISFYVILEMLTDMKLLNSELGRLAISSSMINSVIALAFAAVAIFVTEIPKSAIRSAALLKNLSFVLIIILIVFILRPVMFWMMRQTPEGKPLKQEHILAIHIMIVGSFLVSQVVGIFGFWGPVILGTVTPTIPPMGFPLIDKIEPFVWSVFLPCFLINAGKGVNLFSTGLIGFLIMELLIFVSTIVKLFAIIIPSLYYKMPFSDAVSLGLLLNFRGIYDVQFYSRANRRKILSDETYGIMVMTSMLKSAVALRLLRVFYDPSRRYVAYRRRTIQHNRHDAELRILACIHEQNNAATIINFIGASSPQSPLGLYVLNIEEYVGSSLPTVISHRLDKTPSSKPTRIDIMLNAFRQFVQQSNTFLSVQCFTATSPCDSMHEDICLMAFEKCTSLVIIPFQKTNSYIIKKMMKNVLKISPCSVGILFQPGVFMDSTAIFTRRSKVNVCVIFIGGSDDREALAYGARMAEDENVMLTIIRFFAVNHTTKDLVEEKHDLNLISDLRLSTIDNNNVKYIKHSVQEGADTLHVINSVANDFDLILVGKRHDSDSPVLSGLVEWSEIEELGVIGDVLASSDFKSSASVMVMQQQVSVVEEMVCESPKYISK